MKAFFKKVIISILTFQARIVLKKYKPRVVAITGSVGKTSTKDGLYSVLNKTFFVRKSEKSFNSELGLPLTILDCPSGWNNPFLWFKNIVKEFFLIILRYPYPELLILEVGADRPGDIEKVSKWLKTDIVIITRFGDKPVHVEFFESTEHLVKEKAYLINSLKKDGLLLLNADDKRVIALAKNTDKEVLTYGFSAKAKVCAKRARIKYEKDLPVGLAFDFSYGKNTSVINLKHVFGRHHVYVALCAAAIGLRFDMSMKDVALAVADYIPPPGRLRLLEGIKGSMIIDDTYNSSPVAVLAGLETVKSLKTKGRKIAILGDMLELGSLTVEAHKEVGRAVGDSCDFLFAVGPRARYFIDGALLGGMSEKNIVEFPSAQVVGKHIERMLEKGDIVFIKGSQGMRMEKAVEEIMAHPENRRRVLIRQEKEWRIR